MHHAFLLVGTKEETFASIPLLDKKLGPDTTIITVPAFGIGDARLLTATALQSPFTHTYRVFIVESKAFTHEAQNALLKLLEDPNPTSRFYICVPNTSILIPTLLSRLQPLTVLHTDYALSAYGKLFLEGTYAMRLERISEAIKDKNDVWFTDILNDLTYTAAQTGKRDLMEDILMVSSWYKFPGASKKMLFEHLALTF